MGSPWGTVLHLEITEIKVCVPFSKLRSGPFFVPGYRLLQKSYHISNIIPNDLGIHQAGVSEYKTQGSQIICGCNHLNTAVRAVDNQMTLFKQDDCFTLPGWQLGDL